MRRRRGPWTPAVHHLLRYLADQGFAGAPRPITLSDDLDEVTYCPGRRWAAAAPGPPGFLDGYGSILSPDTVLARLDLVVTAQIALMTARADGGDASYRRMIEAGRADDLATARREFGTI